MEVFYSLDLTIFYFLNHTISTGFLDKFFSIITNVNNWYIAYLILLGILFFKAGRTGKIAVIGIIILITVTDQIGYKLLKEFFERARPCNVLSDVLTPLGCTGSYSFPSNHAINNFAAAAFFSKLFPKYKIILFVVLLVGILLVAGCTKSSNSGYASYNPQQGQQQPYVGGGCGVAPAEGVGDSSAEVSQIPANTL